MPPPDHNFELRQLLKAYRKGLISDEIFEEQLAEMSGQTARPLAAPPPPARVWKSQGKIFHSERELVVHFLDELRAGESFGGTIFDLWQRVASDAGLRGTLRAIGAREAMHGVMLAARLSELGGEESASLPASFAEATRARLASTEVPDTEKLAEVLARLPDVEAATAPLREVISQIEDDIESRSLLELIVADEGSTVSCLRAAAGRLGLSLPDEEDG
jgi:hypothetical protein